MSNAIHDVYPYLCVKNVDVPIVVEAWKKATAEGRLVSSDRPARE